ncbi:TetR/AcrR family transcriptional regulator [Nocardioides jiangxiensis]|uniref:TetR/AcrR family transcriptional regulator n=1 Tax=Nocardioides jiangxiensis TaxID=3064524 RepID=A0ABT9AZ94_9ACTN|nr:TetR/AcrR family transcriptional regulator [Nocardioides sp. WY-20]MDO7867912.1 TetR/AcrR family transcriptional regulator [Nocardioides sp. WY-20]
MPPAAFPDEPVRDGRNRRWDAHREERRRLILDAGAAVVEDSPVGAELTLQDVAERAGLVRTVVQRHFGGRVQLVRAVQADVLERAFSLITGPVDYRGTLREVASHMIGIAVEWVDAHPALHGLVERELGDGEVSELNRIIATYADFLSGIPRGVAAARGIELSDESMAEMHLVFAGIIGQVRATIGHWMTQEPRLVPRERVVAVLSDAISAQIAERAQSYGLDLNVDTPLLPPA